MIFGKDECNVRLLSPTCDPRMLVEKVDPAVADYMTVLHLILDLEADVAEPHLLMLHRPRAESVPYSMVCV